MQTSKPELSILIATQGRREDKFRPLLKKLMSQASKHRGRIEVVAYWNNGESPIGVLRTDLLNEARGEYVCFLDDDDDIPEYYCAELLKALGKDYVGFRVQLFNDGKEMLPVYHSIQYKTWAQDDRGFYRGVTHLNPIRRSIALQGNFRVSDNAGEDFEWARSINHLPKDENYIDKIMYIYKHEREDTSFGTHPPLRETGYRRYEFKYKNFRYHPKSKLLSKEAEQWLKR